MPSISFLLPWLPTGPLRLPSLPKEGGEGKGQALHHRKPGWNPA